MMQRIEGIKEQRADNHYVRSMVFKCFAALYDFKQTQFVTKCRK